MDTERLRKAVIATRKNLRIALQAIGSNREYGKLIPPPDGVDILDGVDATPSELVVYLDHMLQVERTRTATLEHMAMIGAAVEMGMHEVNSEMSHALSGIEGAKRKGGPDVQAELSRTRASLERLSSSLTILNSMSPKSSRYQTHGQDISDALNAMFGRWLESDKIKLEVTPALRRATLVAEPALVMPAVINLVRNALYWVDRSDRPRHVRLDAVTETRTIPALEEGEKPTTSKEVVVIVTDSGPGVPAAERHAVFLPFKSGRGSAGIGLYLTQRKLNDTRFAVVLDPEPGPLGGATFKFGPRAVLEPVPPISLSRREELALAATGIVELLRDGRADDVLRLYAGAYGEICTESLRVRVDGPADETDRALLAAQEAIETALAEHPAAAPAP